MLKKAMDELHPLDPDRSNVLNNFSRTPHCLFLLSFFLFYFYTFIIIKKNTTLQHLQYLQGFNILDCTRVISDSH